MFFNFNKKDSMSEPKEKMVGIDWKQKVGSERQRNDLSYGNQFYYGLTERDGYQDDCQGNPYYDGHQSVWSCDGDNAGNKNFVQVEEGSQNDWEKLVWSNQPDERERQCSCQQRNVSQTSRTVEGNGDSLKQGNFLQVRTYRDVMAGIEALIENLRLVDELTWDKANQGIKSIMDCLNEAEAYLRRISDIVAIAREAAGKTIEALEEIKSRRTA